MSESASASEPAFKSWSYLKAREALWPAAAFSSWVPWTEPPERNWLTIDDEVAKLIRNGEAGPSPGMKDRAKLRPLGTGTPHAFLNAVGELDPFCPYREVGAHWIPFAVQVARAEAERHRLRCDVDAQTIQDIENVLEALDRYCRHDVAALVRNNRGGSIRRMQVSHLPILCRGSKTKQRSRSLAFGQGRSLN